MPELSAAHVLGFYYKLGSSAGGGAWQLTTAHTNKTTPHISSLNILISFRHFLFCELTCSPQLLLHSRMGKDGKEIGAKCGNTRRHSTVALHTCFFLEGTCILALFQTFKSHQEKRNRLCYTTLPSVYVYVPIWANWIWVCWTWPLFEQKRTCLAVCFTAIWCNYASSMLAKAFQMRIQKKVA